MAAVDEKKVLQNIELPKSDALTFIGKYDTERKQDLTVTNTTDVTIAFKLKITAPKLVRLQPGYGYVKPKDKFTIVVAARPYKDGPHPPPRERVVVLLSVAPEGRPDNPVLFWKGPNAPKDPRRQVFPLKFLKHAKVKKGKEKEERKKGGDKKGNKKEEKEESESGAGSGAESGAESDAESDADESEQE